MAQLRTKCGVFQAPCSHQTATRPGIEPRESTSYTHMLLLRRSFLIISSHVRVDVPIGRFPSRFRTNILFAYLISHNPATCPVRFNSRILITP